MKKLLLWIVVGIAVVFGGWQWYQAHERARYGLDESHPFGSFEKLDLLLTKDMGFQKDESTSDALILDNIPEAAKTYRYMDAANSNGFPDKVWLQVSADGRLLSMSAWSRPSYTATALLMKNHWERLTGETMDLDKERGETAGNGWRGKWVWIKPGGFTICIAAK